HAIGAGSRAGPPDEEHKSRTVRGVDQEAGIASDRRARICANPIVHGGADWARSGRCLCREAVGEFPGSDDFLYINDKKSILRWAISVPGAPLRPPAALLGGPPKTPLSLSYNRSEFSDSLATLRSSEFGAGSPAAGFRIRPTGRVRADQANAGWRRELASAVGVCLGARRPERPYPAAPLSAADAIPGARTDGTGGAGLGRSWERRREVDAARPD